MKIRYTNANLTDLERRIPEGVVIGTPGVENGEFVSSHPLLTEEDEILLDESLKRPANVRGRDTDIDSLRAELRERGKDRIAALGLTDNTPGV